MSVSQSRKKRITSPLSQSPVSPKQTDVFELFTIKTQEKPQVSDSQDTSEISDEVFVKPKPRSISTPSKSETNKSYRDKINERFKNVKEKAGKSTKKANVFKEATEKILLERVKRETHDIDTELELMKQRLKLGQNPENREVFEFFCSEKCPQVDEDNENYKSKEKLTEPIELEFELPKFNKAKNLEQEILFIAKPNVVDVIDKIETEEPRFLEDEGFYVPPKLKTSNLKLNILEHRLSRDHKKWFRCDGTLKILENPIQPISYRPNLKTPKIDEIATYFPAKIPDFECDEIIIIRENLLQLQISSIKFTHHPLFSIEHILAQKLTNLFQQYQDGILKNNLQRLTRRLDGLRKLLKRYEENSSQSDQEETKSVAYKRDIKQLQEQVFQEGKKERERIKKILQIWKTIKKTRETNKYSNTSIRLIIKKEPVKYHEDKQEFERKFQEILDEYLDYNREKPRKQRLDEDEIRDELTEKFQESFRAPGEPILYFSLTNDNEITKIIENQKEITRRNVVSSTKIALRIICNKLEVCKTKWVHLQNDFSCNFNESISIQLIVIPKFITIEIIEQPKSLIKRTLGEINLKLPERNTNQKFTKTERFEKCEIVSYKHEGVGSGFNSETLNLSIDNQDLNTSGFVCYTLSWDSPLPNEDNSPQILNEIIDKTGSINPEKLTQWMQHHKPDPQDPKNSILYEFSLETPNLDTPKTQYFRINHQMERWQFCQPKILEDNLRLKILQLRNRNEPEFDRMLVPNRIKEIPLDILADYKRRLASEKETISIEDDEDDELESRRNRGRKLLKQIQIRVFQKCKNSENNLNFEDVVDEKFLPQFEKWIRNFIGEFLNWFQWKPFRFIPEVATQPKLTNHDLRSQLKVAIHIISGLNLPTKNQKVSAFIEADYNNFTARTSRHPGPHPHWNEKIFLPLEPSHLDYLNPNSLNGKITINLYDESDQILTKFPGQKAISWLGSLEISLAAIGFNGIQGMFRVKTPTILLDFDERKPNPNQQTYLNLQISLEPNIPKLNPAIEELPCSDLPYIKEHALAWNEDYNNSYPNRKFSVFAIDPNATTNCIIRYIKPLEPPQINVDGFDVTPDQCARFVSLIPFSDSNQFYQNIWLPTEKFLEFMVGSIIDHAVALTCYLLALKLQVWLLLGYGIPYGSTAFVLVKEHNNNQIPSFYLFDVVEGRRVKLDENFCPLVRVYCCVNETNVWANIQRGDDVGMMRFDFNRRSDWLPLFNNKIQAPTTSIHGIIKYLQKARSEDLEIILDRKIRKKFAKLRQLDRTVWNHHVSNSFKTILNLLEKSEMYGKISDVTEQIHKLKSLYKIRGHVLNLPFNDMNSILKQIKIYGLHLQEDDSIQFASAVYIKSYPNQVLSIWIFLAAIQDKNIND